jgi:hypothetical protein
MTSFQTTGIPKGWEEHGEMTIRTTSKQHTGGATEKKDPLEWMNEGPSVVLQLTSGLLVTRSVNISAEGSG